jgi:HEAT repeat protein
VTIRIFMILTHFGRMPPRHRLCGITASHMRTARQRTMLIPLVAVVALVAGIAQLSNAQGRRTSATVLSEHEVEALDSMSAQSQAELLLERSINHFRGANEQIAARVKRWRGNIQLNSRLKNLFDTAINSDDLVVRTAGLEVDLAARNVEKTSATVDRLEADARAGAQGPRANALWDLGMLGNRGIEPARVAQILLGSIHDDNVNIRYWAVEGLAYLGTDETVSPLLDIFHDDPSPTIRERAACSLAQSGMLSVEQRHTAIPRLLDYAGDYGLDAQTRGWVFQALRDITGQSLPHEPAAWRHWYLTAGSR